MSPQPLVTIVTPSFNQAAYLEQTIHSVLEQDYPNIEYILVDGASTDGSVQIIRKYSDRLAWWATEPDDGQAEAINKGLQRASGEIVAWINSDDLYLPGAVRQAVRALEKNPDSSFVFSDVVSIDAAGEAFNIMRYGEWGLQELMRFCIIGQPGVFMRRAALQNSGYLDKSYHFLLDHHLWLRMARIGQPAYVPARWAAARFHPQAKNVAQAAGFGREAFRIIEWMESQPDLVGVYQRQRSRIWAGAHRLDGRYLQDSGHLRGALAAYLRCFVAHPPTAWAERRRAAFALGSLFFNLDRYRAGYLESRKQQTQDILAGRAEET